MGLSETQAPFIGTVLEGLLYGVYSVVFSLYIRLQVQKRTTDSSPLAFPLMALFCLCTIFFAVDFTQQYFTIFPQGRSVLLTWSLNVTTSMIFTFIDLISQGVLIYRCWVMWNRQPLFIVIPSVLAFFSFATAFTLAAELAKIAVVLRNPGPEFLLSVPEWFTPLGIASFSISLGVNAVVSSLLTLKLYTLHKGMTRTWMAAVGRGKINLLPVISMLIESGMFTFIAQVIYVVFFSLGSNIFLCIGTPIAMVYGITPTLLVVRISMRNIDNRITKFESDIQFMPENYSTTINIMSEKNSSIGHNQTETDDTSDHVQSQVI
ncbi:hypothetical protein GALMADRAFT_206125 [Galerina marginata CBS 339.88]|uniref:G-protein coupled receptors family 1 profile domain-containing protein n=1 Tax=Galerina marginata (strain CBS 339.88) TaxID=685588 RepID=A0A067TX73_GALM3|nr:hypothetical protein GALMADRAFT_206125 [Galerina marginata CBS 339.88]